MEWRIRKGFSKEEPSKIDSTSPNSVSTFCFSFEPSEGENNTVFYCDNKNLNSKGQPYDHATTISHCGCICCVPDLSSHKYHSIITTHKRGHRIKRCYTPRVLLLSVSVRVRRTNKRARNCILNSQTQFAFAPATLRFKSSARCPLSDSR